jgi:predicted DNA-binding transcriptional regulator YafY
MLMLLQSRGKRTAKQLAKELEVSERTVYRDVEALGAAGVPVYASRGPAGGLQLLDTYRTSLTGLTGAEIEALFMLSVPSPLAELNVGQVLQGALLKLSASLAPSRRTRESRARQRIHLDSSGWNQLPEATPHLRTLQKGVWEERKLAIRYSYPIPFDSVVELELEPYGLVAKTNIWYLVASHLGRPVALQVARVREATLLASRFERPAEFNLAKFWSRWCQRHECRPGYTALVRLSAELSAAANLYLGEHVGINWMGSDSQRAGWVRAELSFSSFEEARARLLGLGGAVEVDAPQALRLSVADFALQALRLYQD